MATTSSSAPIPNRSVASTPSSISYPDHTYTITYDVYLSFRGEDTGHSFTDHLYKALLRAGLDTFRDNDDLDGGQDLNPEIKTAITNSTGSIVVFSESYANSSSCLEELALILEQSREPDHFVVPVFYLTEPSDVRKQGESFVIGGSEWTVDNVNRWKEALKEVTKLKGYVFNGVTRMEENTIQRLIRLPQM